MSTWKKYLLLQIPGWLATATIVTLLWHWQLIPGWLALLAFLAWLIKDLIFYPLVRHAYEDGPETGPAALVGTRAVTQGNLDPKGFVRVRGELWSASALPTNQFVASGTEVEIVNTEGMNLFVRAVPKPPAQHGG